MRKFVKDYVANDDIYGAYMVQDANANKYNTWAINRLAYLHLTESHFLGLRSCIFQLQRS